MRETLVPEAAVRELLGMGPLEKMRLTQVANVTKFRIKESADPRLNGVYFRADDVVRFLRLHARKESIDFIDKIATQLRDHAGLSRRI